MQFAFSVRVCANTHKQKTKQRDKQRKMFFSLYIYSGRKKQLTSNVDNYKNRISFSSYTETPL